MKAAVLEQFGAPLEIRDLELAPPGPSEVRVRVAAVGVCHSDVNLFEGLRPALPLPAVLGHEVSGVVTEVGAGVRRIRLGDHVVGTLAPFCGHCPECVTGRSVLCEDTEVKPPPGKARRLTMGERHVSQLYNLSAFAEEMLVHESALVKIRDDMPLDRAALLGCAVLTGVGAVNRTAQVRPGATVAVVGCGGIGLSTINGAAIAGARRIIAVDRNPRKLALARRFGATHCIAATDHQDSAVDEVRQLSGGGVEFAFECVGNPATVTQCWRMLRPAGIAVVLGVLGPRAQVSLGGDDFLQEKQIRGSLLGSARPTLDIPHLVDLYLNGQLLLDELVSRRIRLEEINDGIAALRKGEVARSVVVFDT